VTKELCATDGGMLLDKDGYIIVDQCLRTHATNTWAFGDIISGGPQVPFRCPSLFLVV
jgi:pyruvate/2-oxoglutarate dehydrogenase complex dihydrolipoamide dehydrogenase (E3) component